MLHATSQFKHHIGSGNSSCCLYVTAEMEAMILPPAVKAGDRVAIVAPAGIVSVPFLQAGLALLSTWGLVPVIHQQVYSKEGYLAGSDEERAEALVEAFDDPTLAAVVCAEGGYGCTRLLELLPLHRLGPHNLPLKRFFGFSDITALHCLMRVVVPGYVSFHSPMPATSFFVKGTEFSKDALHQALFAPTLYSACPPLKGRCLQMGRAKRTCGVVRGRLIGGNLTLFTSLLGTPWQEDLHGCVLLLEDVHEVTYRLDRMFTHLESSSGGQQIFSKIGALVLGDFGDALQTLHEHAFQEKVHKEDVERWFWLEQMHLPADLPVLSDLPIGHIEDNRAVPLGAIVDVNLKNCELSVAAIVGEGLLGRSSL